MERFRVKVHAIVEVKIDPTELSEDENEFDLIVRSVEENHPDLRSPSIIGFERVPQ